MIMKFKLSFLIYLLLSCILAVSPLYSDVLLATGNDVLRFSDDLEFNNTFISDTGIAMYTDRELAQVYFSTKDNGIGRIDADGKNRVTLITEACNVPSDIVIDKLNGKIIWSCYSEGLIRRSNLDGSDASTIISGLNEPAGLLVDEENVNLYFTTYGAVQRADLDGQNVTLLAEDADSELSKLVKVGNKIYYANLSNSALMSYHINFDEINIEKQSLETVGINGLDYDSRTEEFFFVGIPNGGVGLSKMYDYSYEISNLSNFNGYDVVTDFSDNKWLPDNNSQKIILSFVGNNPRIAYTTLARMLNHEEPVTILASDKVTFPGHLEYVKGYIYFIDETDSSVSLKRVKIDGSDLKTLKTVSVLSRHSVVGFGYDSDSMIAYIQEPDLFCGGADGSFCTSIIDYDLSADVAIVRNPLPLNDLFVPEIAVTPYNYIGDFIAATRDHIYAYTTYNPYLTGPHKMIYKDPFLSGSISMINSYPRTSVNPYSVTLVAGFSDGKIGYMNDFSRSVAFKATHTRKQKITSIDLQLKSSDYTPYMGIYASRLDNKASLGIFSPVPGDNMALTLQKFAETDFITSMKSTRIFERYGRPEQEKTQTISGQIKPNPVLNSSGFRMAESLAGIAVYISAKSREQLLSKDNSLTEQVIFTDDTGQFSFNNLPEGEYEIFVKKPGLAFVPTVFDASVSDASFTVLAFNNTEDFPGCSTENKDKISNQIAKKVTAIARLGIKQALRNKDVKLARKIKSLNAKVVLKEKFLPTSALYCDPVPEYCSPSVNRKSIKAFLRKLGGLTKFSSQANENNQLVYDKIQKKFNSIKRLIAKLPKKTYVCVKSE